MKDSTKSILYVIMAIFFIIASIFTFHWLPVIMIVVCVVAAGYYSTKLSRKSTYNADGKILEKIKGRSIEEYSNKRKRKNMYVILCFVSSPLLFFADFFADLLTWIPIGYIWIPLIPIFVGIWYLKTTTSKPKPKPVKQKPAKKKETSEFCENCGNTLNPKAKFCGSCGTPVS